MSVIIKEKEDDILNFTIEYTCSSFTHFMMIKIKGIKDIVEHFGLCLSIHHRLSLHLSVNLLP